jgi:hypothetical protein
LYAYDSFCSIFKHPREEWNLPNPMFCHGLAGLLMTTWVMAQDVKCPQLKEKTTLLTQYLLESYSDKHPFGFTNREPCRSGGHAEINQLSLIEGASGILLTLLSLNGSPSPWHAPFLIGDSL